MTTILAGIDEAGYGPVLGPLTIVCCAVSCDDEAACDSALRAYGVKDSKQVYSSGRLAALEAIALAGIGWLASWQPSTAAELFAIFKDGPAERTAPWQAGADELSLPHAATAIPDWSLPAKPAVLTGHLCHPAAINACYRGGGNRAAFEADKVAGLIGGLPSASRTHCIVDRLGGRRYYGDVLTCAHPFSPVEIIEEAAGGSRYHLPDARLTVEFLVKADRDHAITALASCIAKYLREIDMLLFNRYWCTRFRWLTATAGYPQDAKRWLHQIGAGLIEAHADELVRGDPTKLLA